MYPNEELENYLVNLHEYELVELQEDYVGLSVLADRYSTSESDLDSYLHILLNLWDTTGYLYSSPQEVQIAFRAVLSNRCRAADQGKVSTVDHDLEDGDHGVIA